jgi:hypothetical protein
MGEGERELDGEDMELIVGGERSAELADGVKVVSELGYAYAALELGLGLGCLEVDLNRGGFLEEGRDREAATLLLESVVAVLLVLALG